MSDWLPAKYRKWVDLREELGLTHAEVQMARDLGMDVDRCRRQASSPSADMDFKTYLKENFLKRFGQDTPDDVKSIEQIVADREQKKIVRQKTNEIRAMMGTQDLPPHRLHFKVEIESEEGSESEETGSQ